MRDAWGSIWRAEESGAMDDLPVTGFHVMLKGFCDR